MNPSSSYEAGSSSTPHPQRAPTNGKSHHLHSSKSPKSPYTSSQSPSRPDDFPMVPGSADRSGFGPGLGRQRVRTEPSPRHPQQQQQQPTSGWLGSYNEQSSPLPPVRSPRGPRQAGTPDRIGGGGSGGLSGSDRILDTHRALGSWQFETGSTAGSDGGGTVGFRQRNFDGGAQTGMEPSNSLQSLVESIDDDHVFKLTEMTKKRVEHSNPTQKRQRVVSLPTSEVALAIHFQPSEKTLQLSNSCKTFLETRYTQLYQSINEGHPVNRLDQLRQILPRIKGTTTTSKQSGHYDGGKTSMDSNHSRPRRSKSDKYRFVDKVEESSCTWDVDHMEARAAAEEAAESAARARATAKATSTESFVQSSSSRDSIVFSNHAYIDSPLATMDSSSMAAGMSPSSTVASMTHTQPTSDSTSASLSSLDPLVTSGGGARPPKETPGDTKLRITQVAEPTSPSQQLPTPTIAFPKGELPGILEPAPLDASPSKRNSFLGFFGTRGKKSAQELGGENFYYHESSPQSTSSYGSPRLSASGPMPERQSLDSQHSPYLQPSRPTTTTTASSQSLQRMQPAMEIVPPLSFNSPAENAVNQGVISGFSSKRTSIDEDHRPHYHFGDPGSAAMTDDENGGHYAPPAVWPQGERDDSQDESDTAVSASQKRSSTIRRFTDKMWKRGPKALSAIHTTENNINNNSPDGVGPNASPRVGPTGMMTMMTADPQARIENRSPMMNSRADSFNNTTNPYTNITRSPRMLPAAARGDKSPMMQPARNIEKSPLIMPTSSTGGEEGSNQVAPITTGTNLTTVDLTKPVMNPAPQLLIDVERIPKRMLDSLKSLPELASVNWTSDTVDLSALLNSTEKLPTYDEYVGITSTMKESDMYPKYLDDVDVLHLHMNLSQEEVKDPVSKDRARKWDLLELRVDQELELGEKWIKEVSNWSKNKVDAIQRHCRIDDEGWIDGEWHLDANAPLVEEPDEEQETASTTTTSSSPTAPTSMSMFSSSSSLGSATTDHSRSDSNHVASRSGENSKHKRIPHIAPLETLKARKQYRDMSLTTTRDMNGSMSSLHASATMYSFKASLESTRESVADMRVYLAECRDRLFQLEEATGAPLQEKEPVFKDIVDKFTMEWNGSYFVALKEVEDQIQVMNLKRIENPWMDMLLIMLSWVIRGLFYIVEGVTIMIIIIRHAWQKAKNGYEVIRNARREQERLSHRTGPPESTSATIGRSGSSGAGASSENLPGANGHANGKNHGSSASSARTVGAWS